MSEQRPPPTTRVDCCQPVDPRIARHFDADMRRHESAGRFPPMAVASRALLELLGDVSQRRPSLLELGAGSGALTVALLEKGATRADAVDLSPQSVATAERRAREAGVADRATFTVGDAAQAVLEPHDWVVLDRVICCYSDVEALLGNAIGAARQRIAFSVPHVHGWRGLVNRLIVTVENATNRLRGRPCPGYLHAIRLIDERLAEAGFRRLRQTTAGLWYVAVYERAQST